MAEASRVDTLQVALAVAGGAGILAAGFDAMLALAAKDDAAAWVLLIDARAAIAATIVAGLGGLVPLRRSLERPAGGVLLAVAAARTLLLLATVPLALSGWFVILSGVRGWVAVLASVGQASALAWVGLRWWRGGTTT